MIRCACGFKFQDKPSSLMSGMLRRHQIWNRYRPVCWISSNGHESPRTDQVVKQQRDKKPFRINLRRPGNMSTPIFDIYQRINFLVVRHDGPPGGQFANIRLASIQSEFVPTAYLTASLSHVTGMQCIMINSVNASVNRQAIYPD